MRRLWAFAALAASLAAPVLAQPGALAWEHVGDRPFDLANLALGPDGYLYAAEKNGLVRLPPPYGPDAAWEPIERYQNDPVLTLGPDTVFTYRAGVERSTDGGRTFERTFGGFLVQDMVVMPPGVPHAGRVVAGGSGAFGVVSDDRGATWTEGTPPEGQNPEVTDLAVVTAGPRAGRIVASAYWGAATSDDGGLTWTASELWGVYRYRADGLTALDVVAPDGTPRLALATIDVSRPGSGPGGDVYVYVSDDGGTSWRETAALDPGHGNPGVGYPAAAGVVSLGGGRAVVVMRRGQVYGTDDGGETWALWGTTPPLGDEYAESIWWAWAGPGGRLYVGLNRNGPSSTWTWRTTAALAVAAEGAPAPAALAVRVEPNPAGGHVTLTVTASGAPVELAVFDALGREVLSRSVETGRVRLDVSALSPGVYVVRATSGGRASAARFVVAR